MKGTLYIARLFILLLFAFALSRLIFLCFFFSMIRQEHLYVIVQSFFYALKTDVSAVCYVLILPLLLLLIESLVRFKYGVQFRRAYVKAVLVLNAFITSVDLGLYEEWGVKTNYKALMSLAHPAEVFSTATVLQMILVFALTLIQCFVLFYLYRRFVRPEDEWTPKTKTVSIISYLVLIPLALLGMRGGLKQIPVQASDAYYSTNPHLNWAAVNSLWNLGQSILAGYQYGYRNPYQFLSTPSAQGMVRDLYKVQKDSTVIFLKEPHPNIVLIIFEGWSADLIGSISADSSHSATPNFDALASNGILFTNCLASGERSDQGVTAVLSSFPSLPLSSIVNYPDKVNHLPPLLKPFSSEGYSSLFLFGGQLSYGNLKALIYHNGFEKVIEEKDIDRSIYRGRLGVHDESTFNILGHELNGMKPPFFAGFFTQSTHFSYDYPKEKKPIAWAGNQSDYVNSLMYADSCLGDFFMKAKKESWYAHTLFIMVSDHSHVLAWSNDHRTAALHHIPLLFCGDVIKEDFRGMKKTGIVSQQDICATLLTQVNMPHEDFKWSKDIMNPTAASFAYWTFGEGFGFTRAKDCEMAYDLANKRMISEKYQQCDSAQTKSLGLSYLQEVFDDFLREDSRFLQKQK